MRAVRAGLQAVSAVMTALLITVLPLVNPAQATASFGLPAAPLGVPVAHAAGGPDLQSQSMSVPSLSGIYYVGTTYTAGVIIRNVGDTVTSGGWGDELYLSTNSTYDSGDRFITIATYGGSPLNP